MLQDMFKDKPDMLAAYDDGGGSGGKGGKGGRGRWVTAPSSFLARYALTSRSVKEPSKCMHSRQSQGLACRLLTA